MLPKVEFNRSAISVTIDLKRAMVISGLFRRDSALDSDSRISIGLADHCERKYQ
jgi:hypothetical protein